MQDATNLMNNILSDFNRYTTDMKDSAESERRHGDLDSYYLDLYSEASSKKDEIINYLKEAKPGYYLSKRKQHT